MYVDVTSQFINGGVVVGMKGRFDKANDTFMQPKAGQQSCRSWHWSTKEVQALQKDACGSAHDYVKGNSRDKDISASASVQSLQSA